MWSKVEEKHMNSLPNMENKKASWRWWD